MGFFANLGGAMFGKAKAQAPAEYEPPPAIGSRDVMGMSGSALEMNGRAPFEYHFNPVPINRTPGPAYVSPLLQFQEYPKNVVEGWGGIAYKRGFQPHEPLTAFAQSRPVPSGTSGVIHGQVFYQPLADTNGNTVAG